MISAYAQTEQSSTMSENSKSWTGLPRSGTSPRENPSPMSTLLRSMATPVARTAGTPPISSLVASSAKDFVAQLAHIQDTAIANSTPVSIVSKRSGEGNGQGNGDGGERAESSQMAIIILSSVIGSIIITVLGLLLWHYYKRHQKELHPTRLHTPDENEFEKWRLSSLLATPRADNNPVPQTPLQTHPATQSHISKRYYAQPTSVHAFERGQSSPSSTSGLLRNINSFGGSPSKDRSFSGHRYSSSANNVRGYMQHRAERTRSTQSLTTHRAPTRLFGNDRIQCENEEIPQVPNPVRPRSTPLSPLAGSSMSSEFDFGFQKR
jgi:hypothetical protein